MDPISLVKRRGDIVAIGRAIESSSFDNGVALEVLLVW